MKIKILRGLAIFLIIEVGLTHYFTADHAYEESWIEGYLFVANFLGAFLAAYGIYRRKTWGWVLGFSVAGGAMLAYIWSRTSGLPGLPPEEWLDPWGITAFIVEGLFCLLALLCLLWRGQPEATIVQPTNRWRYLLPVVGLLGLALINVPVHRLDVLYPELDHAHVFFLWQVRLQPELSHEAFEEEYGIQISQAAVSALDSIVDVRMIVLDPEKAEQLIEEGHFALLVGDTLIPAPHVSRHMLVNKTIIVMFPNRNNIVKSGTPVSVVFENLKVEPVAVK
jgi:hypothetical protein